MPSVEAFAGLCAALETSHDLDRVLADAGLSSGEWIEVRRHYLDRLTRADESRRGFAIAFTAAYELARAAGRGPSARPVEASVVAPPLELFDADQTQMLPVGPPRVSAPALPFSGESDPSLLDQLLGSVMPSSSGDRSSEVETFEMVRPVLIEKPRSGTFKDQLAAEVIPVLSLDEYAELRAEIAFHGEDDPETLKRFGVSSPAVHAALKARFAEYFHRDPAAQERFVAMVQRGLATLKSR